MSCVLWPENVCTSGFFYGWSSPLICVAGVLDFNSRTEADLALQNAVILDRLARVKEFCRSNPAILGRCTFHHESPPISQPDLEFFDRHIFAFTLVTYRRPNLGKLEIHTLDGNIPVLRDQPSAPSPPRCPSAAHVAHDFTRPSRHSSRVLDTIVIHQMNYGQLFEQKITNTSPKALLPLRNRAKQVGSVFARLHTHSRTLSAARNVYPTVYRLYTILQETSALCQQACIRLQQLVGLPGNVPVKTYDDGLVSAEATAEYVAFYNCVWLILNDVIIGWAIGSFIRENASPIASVLNYWLRRLLINDLQRTLIWLNSWPAGLKLNTELSQFLCHSLLGVVMAWNRLLSAYVLPHIQTILYISGCLGYCGMTITVAVISDLLALLTVHVHICYLILCTVYREQLSIAGSLWNLFRGKRYNVLRKRIDSWSYDVDQLLFGTILFTLMAFLFPTTVAYYALFALIRLVVILAYAISDVLLVLINEFPLFALLLRVKDPFRLPGGIAYVLYDEPHLSHVKSEAATVGSIFVHYGKFWSAFSAHYHPAKLAWQFVTSTRLTHLTSK